MYKLQRPPYPSKDQDYRGGVTIFELKGASISISNIFYNNNLITKRPRFNNSRTLNRTLKYLFAMIRETT